MELSCPHCGFKREIADDKLPERAMRVVCPGCGERFPWRPAPAAGRPRFVQPAPVSKTCPVCGLEQASALACRGCGVIFARLADRRRQEPAPAAPLQPPAAPSPPSRPARPAPQATAKAGFGLRLIAVLIDGLVYTLALLLVALGLGGIIGQFGAANPQLLSMMILLALFVLLVLGSLYRVFFIGYCGQTPGKMVTRIKVVRTNGDEIGFGAAIFREVIGKLISALLFGCGYLMVLFDDQKQGLHDKIADTYVVKL